MAHPPDLLGVARSFTHEGVSVRGLAQFVAELIQLALDSAYGIFFTRVPFLPHGVLLRLFSLAVRTPSLH